MTPRASRPHVATSVSVVRGRRIIDTFQQRA
jgi:hypothetical protein